MLIALYGHSSSGKTTLARALVLKLACQLRACGDVVRERAKARELPIEALPQSDHDDIDSETRRWSSGEGARLVEGRFLDQVLATEGLAPILIEVVADPDERARRWAKRLNQEQTLADVAAYDAEDEAFRVRSYGNTARLQPSWILDTSNRSEDSCLEELITRLPKPD